VSVCPILSLHFDVLSWDVHFWYAGRSSEYRDKEIQSRLQL